MRLEVVLSLSGRAPSTEGLVPPLSPPGVGAVIDSTYRLESAIGEGAAGVVYEATHLGLRRTFALKVLRGGSVESARRFRREAEALGRLRHPHIVDVTDFGIDRGSGAAYLVMERLEGKTLSDICNGPLPTATAAKILRGLSEAVDFAADQGVLHRDLKPANVVLCLGENGGWSPKVLDFGLAQILDGVPSREGTRSAADLPELPQAGLTRDGDLVGTPLYVAPEVIRGEPTTRASDVYSFGALAYEMLVGRPPFPGTTREAIQGHLSPALPDGAGHLPPELAQALRQALAKDPAKRPATTGAVVDAIEAAARDAATASWRRRERPRRMVLALVLALCGAGLAVGVERSPLGPVLDRVSYDLLARFAPARRADPRLLLIVIDERSLQLDPTPLSARGDEMGRVLSRALAAGARGVALDLLLPPGWKEATEFQDLLLRHPGAVTLAATASSTEVVGAEAVSPLTEAALGSSRAAALFGIVNVEGDPDGRVRRGTLAYRATTGARQPSWAARAASTLVPSADAGAERIWIDPSIDRRGFARLSWQATARELDSHPEMFQDRLVLVGVEFAPPAGDQHRLPARPGHDGVVSGLTLQALQVDTILRGMPVRRAGSAIPLTLAALAAQIAAFGVLYSARPIKTLAAAVLSLAGAVTVVVIVASAQDVIMPAAPALVTVAVALVLALALRPRLSRAPSEETNA